MKKVFFVLISNFILAITLVNKVLAQDALGVNELANGGIALGTRSIQDTIAGIINIFLGFLGILATLLILYGGYLWMTSRGNSEKVAKAKLLIASAVIGLVIILSAYAISRFILSRLYDTTGGGGGGTTTPPVVIIPSTCSTPTNPDEPRICSISRTAGPVGSRVTLYGYHFDTNANGLPDVDGKVELVDTATGIATEAEVVECASSTMWQDGMVRVRVPDTLAIGNYQIVLTNDINISTSVAFPTEVFDFTVNNDPTSVFVDCINPNPVLVEDLPRTVDILGEGFGGAPAVVTMSGGVDGTTLLNLNVNTWSDLQINVDIPTNAISSDVIVDVFGDTDWDRLNISCSAATEGQCVSGCCSLNSCVQENICTGTTIIPGSDAPVIQSISPEDGEAGTLVTIFGYNFGDSANPGTVTIGGDVALAPVCGNIWNDNYIIVEVPAGDGSNALFDVVVTEAAALGGEASDPYVGFDRNDTVRPGICALSASDGSYGDDLDIDGVNFTGATAYFDTVASYETTILDANNSIAEVPNVVGSLGVTMKSPSGVDSNQFPFSALAITSGAPVITELSPDNGPVEAYVTIMGANFGDNVGLVLFDPDNDPNNANEVPGTFDFPTVCGDYWFNDHIIVKVPNGPWTIGDSYPIRIKRNGDGAVSNDFDFRVTNVPPGPQICSVSPDNGPVGNLVNISGEAFGSSGDVLFYDGATGVSAASIISWSSNQAFGVEVPVGASTGPVVVQDAAGNNSNGIIFNVGACSNNLQCGADICCSGAAGNYCAPSCGVVATACEYYWDVSTQAEPFGLVYNYSCASGLQSPSPWPDGHDGVDASGFLFPQSSLDAFVDTNITALFTRNVLDADFNATNIILHQCDTPACASYATDISGVVEIINQNSDREGFVFNPNADLLPDTWYEVELGTFHAAIGADSWTPDPVLDEWTFKTRDSGLLCEVSSIAVTPQSPQANIYPGQEMNFSSSPLATNCNVCGGSYDWQWSINHNPGPVSSYASHIPAANTDVNNGFTRLTAGPGATQLLPASDDSFVTVEATNLDYPAAGAGQSYPIILAPILRIENKVPNCDDSCGNAQIWVDFNTELQLPLAPSQFELHQCTDATCSAWGAANLTSSIDATSVSRRVELDGLTTALVGGQSYIVIVDPGVTNVYGYPLGGSLADRSWTFTVGTENCQMTGANILPDNYTTYSVNDIVYNGYALANGGSCGEQAIHCDTCDWDWTESSGGTIASIATGAQNVLATPAGVNGSTNINLTIDGTSMSYGTVSDSTPLTVNISGGTSISTQLAVSSYWPSCGACTNSMAEIWFNSDLQAATVNDTNIRIYNITDGVYDAITILPIIANRHVTIDHGLFDLGKEYRIEVSDAVLNNFNDNIAGGWQSPPFLIEQAGCLADAVSVDPATATAAASQSLNYRAVTTYNAASCGPTPINCSTCSYNWQNNSLGTFTSGATTPDAVFQTLATVTIGQSDIVTLSAQEGTNILPVTNGLLTIGGIPFNVTDYWPNCDGACTNSVVGVRFDTPINETTVAGNYLIVDITGPPTLVSNGYTITGGGNTLIIEHDPFILGHTYRVTIRTDIENIYGQHPPVQNIIYPNTALRWVFTTGEADCRVQSVNVDPAIKIATASEAISYNAETLANTVSCGDLPVYCDSCTYSWRDWTNDLGDFNSAVSRNPIFTTAPTVVSGDSTNIEVDVLDQGTLFEDYGVLGINVGSSLTEEVSLIENNPAGGAINICNNVAPYVVFDISGGDLNRNSLVSHFGLYEQCASGWCAVPGAVRFIDATPGLLTAVFEQSNLLSNFTRYFVGFDDASQVLGQNGNPIVDMNPDPGFANWNYIGANDLGWYFDTSDQSCAAHSVEIDPEEDLFTCINPSGCSGDESGGNSGNQHLYESFTYDIRGQILTPASLAYSWVSADNNIVFPITTISQSILATAGTNGTTNLGVEVNLLSTPANTVSDSSPVEVNTCQTPWPSLATYPWDDSTFPDMNFSTYYCQNYGLVDEISLPYIDIPHITSSPEPNVIREYISTIYYGTVLNEKNPYLGSLAYADPKEKKNTSWKEKLGALFKTESVNSQSLPVGCTPLSPVELSYTYDGANTIVFSWRQPPRIAGLSEAPEYFQVQRLESGVDVDFVNLDAHFPVHIPVAGNYSFTDNTVTADSSYRYRVIAHNSSCSPTSVEPIANNPTLMANTSSGGSLVDIIGFRIMKNEEHLSVVDWYKKNAPNPEDLGTRLQIDGYEALQIGGTVYISAANIWSDTLYTNIYIIAHNIGANATTINIYNQMLENFKLNVDMLPAAMSNTCHSDNTITCSSDFDCPTGYCDSQGLKIRRDVKRLGELVNINKAILIYGENHKACSNNSLISCNLNSDCPSPGTCVAYFPPLNSGSYLSGLSNSSWPSWQETLAGVLGSQIPEDPINLFNGCSSPYNPDTCWDEAALDFSCPANSLVYIYNILGVGQDYYLGANFEYDMYPAAGTTFIDDLDHPIANIDLNINSPHCDASSVAAPGFPNNPYCGNGVLDSNYCTIPCPGCSGPGGLVACTLAGGTFVTTEECDSEFWDYACSASPATASPAIPIVGNHEWWNEQTIGCNPRGAIDTSGNLVECTWYRPDPAFTAGQCGGYCGDGTLQSYYETCDGAMPAGDYHCREAGVTPYCGVDTCQVLCNNAGNIYPAALCGDGIWSEGTEQCDPSANPSGLAGWDCSTGGSISCSNSCQRVCSAGAPYEGICGDGNTSSPGELCDYENYTAPSPLMSRIDNTYGCTTQCTFDGRYCGDGVQQYAFGELCESSIYQAPEPIFSDIYNQYECSSECRNDQIGGYCGDGAIDGGYGEDCDPGTPWDGIPANPPALDPEDTDVAHQYACDVDCVGTTGGYCGDGDANEIYEVCDGADYPNRPTPALSSISNTYACADNCGGGAVGGGYCGDGVTNQIYYEGCDWGNPENPSYYPWPRGASMTNFSDPMNQYVCSTCMNTGGYCGNGVVDGACTANCSNWYGGVYNSNLNCSEAECMAQGGTFTPYEQCDSGFDPAYVIEKNVDLVYIFDMSGSMAADATALCNSTQDVANNLDTRGIAYRISIMVLGDSDSAVLNDPNFNEDDGTYGTTVTSLTASTNDDIDQLFGQSNDDWIDEAQQVFRALVTDCALYQNNIDSDPNNNYDNVRYLSFYDNATNDISSNILVDGDIYNYPVCMDSYDYGGRLENWGYAAREVASYYDWRPDYHRVIVPVSDEAAYCGGNTGNNINENYDAATLPDILIDVVTAARAMDPIVHISPVLLRHDDWLAPVGQAVANDTGGLFTNITSGWAAQTINIINSTFCDGDGDGHMDCTLVP